MIPGMQLRIINFVIASLIFVFISHHVARATGDLTEWLCQNRKVTSSKAPSIPLARTPGTEYVALSPIVEEQEIALRQPDEHSISGPATDVWKRLTECDPLVIKMMGILIGLWALNLI